MPGFLTPILRGMRLPFIHGPIALAAIVAVGVNLGPQSYWGFLLTLTLLYAIAALGLNIPGGFLGQLSMGQGAVFAVGAYAAAILTTRLEWPIIATVPAAFVAGAVVGLLTGIPAERIGFLGLGMVTLGLTLIASDIATNLSTTGGPNGLTVPGAAILPGGHHATADSLYVVIAVVTVLTYIGHWYLRGSNFGRAALAIKSDQLGATALGMRSYWIKVFGFALGSGFGAVAGSFYGYVQGFVSPDAFGPSLSILLLLMILLGGAGTRVGPVLGIAIIGILPLVLASYPGINVYIDGGLLILVVRFLPNGLYGRPYAPVGERHRTSKPERVQAIQVNNSPRLALQSDVVLTLGGVTRTFGGVRALGDVSMTLERGSVLAVVGPNGSGKTTLLNVTCGYYPANSGEIDLDGTSIVRSSPAAISRLGVARTFQVPKTFSALSLDEHLALTEQYARADGDPQLVKLAHAFLAEFGLMTDGRSRGPRQLDHGHLRFLEVGLAVARKPRLLLLDEPAAGLSAPEIQRLIELVRSVADLGVGVILVEHHLDLVRKIADQVLVMNLGEPLWQGAPSELEQSALVREAYLGTA